MMRALRLSRFSALVLLGALVLGGGCASDKGAEGGVKKRTPPDEPWRKDRPAAGEAPDVKLPKFESATLKNGLTLIVAEEHTLPIVDVRLVVRAGTSLDKAKDAGLAQLAYDMLDEGAEKMDALALADAIATIGTSVSIGAGRDAGAMSMQVLKRNLEEAVRLMSLMATKPRFTKDDFERVRARHLSSLTRRAGNPRAVAGDVADATAFGSDHPYGQLSQGTAETVGKLRVSSAKRFWQSHAGPKNAALVFAGDVTLDEAKELANKMFGKWRSRAKAPKPPKDPAAAEATALRLVDFPGTPQTVVYFMRPMIKAGDPDEDALTVMNQILGGMFSSRLNLNLREDKGWTYGAFSFLAPRVGVGSFGAGAGIKTEHTADATSEFLKEFGALASDGVKDEAELQAAKDNAIKSLPGRFETISAMSSAAAALWSQGRPMDYYVGLPERLTAITAEDVKRVADKALKKDGMTIVFVGDKKVIGGPLGKLELGELVQVDATGAPIKADQ
jgi:zinc protease